MKSMQSGIELFPVGLHEPFTHFLLHKACNGVSLKPVLPHRMVQFNYLVDHDWMTSEIQRAAELTQQTELELIIVSHPNQHSKPVALNPSVQPTTTRHGSLTIHTQHIYAHLPIPYGTHHTKMMFLFYENHLRIVIHTSNMVPQDWGLKTQGMWMSPLLKQTHSQDCDFKLDLLAYLRCYGSSLDAVIKQLVAFDFNPCRAILIASVPGRHKGNDLHKWGHLRLKSVLQEKYKRNQGKIVCQISSIGSLGKTPDWLMDELYVSLSASSNESVLKRKEKGERLLDIVFPTVDNVRNSLEGWAAGHSIPFDKDNWMKQKHYMKHHICSWNAKDTQRHLNMPHIKTFCRLSDDNESGMEWFLLTSSNLSKAAWGALEKNKSQLMIRSFELGVLLLPQLFQESPTQTVELVKSTQKELESMNETAVMKSLENEITVGIPLPYDLPTVPYTDQEECWTWNTQYLLPDIYGNIR